MFSVVAVAVPNNPSNLRLVPGTTTVDISWQDNSDNESGFKIFRDGKLIHVTNANETHFKDSGLTPSTTYSYEIKATDDMSVYSVEYIKESNRLVMHGIFASDSHLAFYIDADNDPQTGYSGNIRQIRGADYLIVDSVVYRYPPNTTGWHWDEIGNTPFQRDNTHVTANIPQNLIHLGEDFKFLASLSTHNWDRTLYSNIKEIGDTITVGSDNLMITFLKRSSGIKLDSVTTNGRDILQNSISLFDLSVAKVDDIAHPISLKADSDWQNVTLSQNGNRATLTWSHPTKPNLPTSLTVTATVEVDNDKAKWDLKVQGLGTHHTLMDTTFPQFDIKADGNDHLFVPFKFGKVVDNPAANDIGFNNLQYPRGWSATMQFMAYYNSNYGLYLGIHDPHANIKQLQATHHNGAVHIVVTVPAPNKTIAGNDWEFPGEFEMDIFSGDWYDAAMIYKKWVYAEADYKPSQTLRQSTKNLKKIDIWGVVNVYKDSKVLNNSNFADRIKEANNLLNPQGQPHIDFANYFLAASGKVNEDDMPRFYPSATTIYLNDQLKSAGIPTMMYTNAYGYDIEMDDSDEIVPPFEEMKAYAAKHRNGQIYQKTWNAQDGNQQIPITTAYMCPTQKRWQDLLVNVHKNKITPLGLSGVLLDQMSAANARECFDPNHAHPLGGGHYWHDGYKRLTDRIRSAYPAGTFLVTEGASDDMMNMVDGFELVHNYLYDGVVPALSVLYGDKVSFIGISAGVGGRKAYDYNEMYSLKAYSFALGMTTGYFYLDFKDKPNVVNYIRKLSLLKEKLEAYISYGTMARKPIVSIQNNPQIHITVSDQSMTAGALQYSAWKHKDGKSVAFVFINGQEPGRQTLNFSFSIDPTRYGLHGDLKLKRITHNGEEDVQIGANQRVDITLDAADAVAYVLSGE